MNIGETICDMHYGLPAIYNDNIVEVSSHIRLRIDGSTVILTAILAKITQKYYINKMAIVVDYSMNGYIAAYSYDDRHLGLFEFRLLPKELK